MLIKSASTLVRALIGGRASVAENSGGLEGR